jgi:tetratricopeptide (TPR) repeat protein
MEQSESVSRARAASVGWLARGVVCAALVALGACANGEGLKPREGDASPLGKYLAGRYAGSLNDTRAAADYFSAALDEDPQNLALLRRTFLLKIADDKFDEALPLARRLIAAGMGEGTAELVLALDAVDGGDWQQARDTLAGVKGTGANALVGPVLTAWTFEAEGRTDEAMAALEQLSDKSYAAFGDFQRALIAEAAGRPEIAEPAYRALMGGAAGAWVRSVEAYGGFLERAGRKADAKAVYDDFLARSPGNPVIRAASARLVGGGPPPLLVRTPREGVAEVLYGAASVLAQDNVRDASVIYLRLALHERPAFPLAASLLADVFEQDSRWPQAIAVLKTIEKDPILGWNARQRTALALDRMDRTNDAIAALKAMIAERPDDLEAQLTLADLLRERERFADAIPAYDRAIQMISKPEERHWVIYYARGVALERAKRWDEAEADFLKALDLSPDQAPVLNYLAYSWVEQGKKLPDAQRMIERAVALKPDDGYIVDSLGWVLYRQGRYEEAVKKLERAVELKPEDPIINDHLGDAYWQVGRRIEARFQWRHALALKPDADLAQKLSAKLDGGLPDRQTASGTP